MSDSSANRVIKLQDTETLKFIALYGRERILYDQCMREYKDKTLRLAAAKRISKAMQIPGFGPKEVISKFKNLRSSYCQELKKITDSEAIGDLYMPKVVWFETMNAFIRPFVQQRSAKVLNDDLQPEVLWFEQKSSDESDESFVKDEITNGRLELSPSGPKRKKHHEPTTSKMSRCCHEDPTEDFMYTALEKLEEITNRSLCTSEDSFDYFGKYIASTLRELGPPIAIKLQEEITRLISKAYNERLEQRASNTATNASFLSCGDDLRVKKM